MCCVLCDSGGTLRVASTDIDARADAEVLGFAIQEPCPCHHASCRTSRRARRLALQAVPAPPTLALLRQHSGGIYALARIADQASPSPVVGQSRPDVGQPRHRLHRREGTARPPLALPRIRGDVGERRCLGCVGLAWASLRLCPWQVMSCSNDFTVCVWDANTFSFTQLISGHAGPVRAHVPCNVPHAKRNIQHTTRNLQGYGTWLAADRAA